MTDRNEGPMADMTEMEFNQLDTMPIDMCDEFSEDYSEHMPKPSAPVSADDVVNTAASTKPQLLEKAWLQLDLALLYRQIAANTSVSTLKLLYANKLAWTETALALQKSRALTEYQVMFRGQLERHFDQQELLRKKIRGQEAKAQSETAQIKAQIRTKGETAALTAELETARKNNTEEADRLKAQLEKARQHVIDIIASSIEYRTMPVAKLLQAEGFHVTYQDLVELRKIGMGILRENAEHIWRLKSEPEYLHAGVLGGWLDQPLEGVADAIAQMKKIVGSAFEIEPPSRLEQAEQNVYSNELMILSDLTEQLVREMIAESGCNPAVMAPQFANSKTVVTEKTSRITALKPGISFADAGISTFEAAFGKEEIPAEFTESRVKTVTSTSEVVTDEEMQVATVRAVLAILRDDRNFLDKAKRSKGRQYTLDRLRLAEQVQEELEEFTGTRITKHSYSMGKGITIKVPRTERPLTAQQILHDHQAPDTLWVTEIRRSAKDAKWTVLEYGRARIVSEALFARQQEETTTALHGRETRTTFERW